MKFSCNKEILIKEISSAQKIIAAKSSITSISNVVLSATDSLLTIKATDAKTWFETQIAVNIEENGEIAIFCDRFFNILKALPQGDILFQTSGSQLEIKSMEKASIDISLRYQTSEGFPLINMAPQEQFFRLGIKDFLKMREHTIFAVSKEETRVFVNGVFMEQKEGKLVMVATDAKRLSLISKETEYEIPPFEGIIIPPKFLNLVKDLSFGEGEISLAIADKTIYARFDNLELAAVLIDGRFPNYSKVIPESLTHQLTFNRSEFLETLKRVSLMTDMKLNRIFITFEGDKAILKSVESDMGEIREEINGVYIKLDENYAGPSLTEEPVMLALNHTFLQEPLSAINEKEFSFRFTSDTTKPIAIYPVIDQDYFHIIMPMQLD